MSGGSGTGTPVTIPGAAPASAFQDQLNADLAVFYNTDEFAKALVYTSLGGAPPQAVRGIVDYGTGDDYGGTLTIYERARLRVAASGTYGVVLSKKGDTVTIDEIVWTVDLPKKSADGSEWEIELVK
jgi:hypothetical protein